MDRGRIALVGALVVSIGAAGWLYNDNRKLRSKLETAKANKDDADTKVAANSKATTRRDRKRRRRSTADSFVEGLSRAATRSRPKLKAEKKETRLERRKRRMSYVRALLGRMDGETEKEYRERMVPMIKKGLEPARDRVEKMRKKIEEEANISDDQKEQLDKAFDDIYSELLELTNKSVKEGDLTPYERNWKGLLTYAGGLGAVLDTAEGRIGKILSPEQQNVIYNSGFEWGEYLGVSAPWERLDPPPPPPDNSGG